MNILGCSHASVKTGSEIWLIDPYEVTLYRYIEGNREEVIPIEGNNAVKKFMCISEQEYEKLVRELVEKRGE